MSTFWPYNSCVSHSRQPESYKGHITLAIVLKMRMVQFEVYSKVPISFKWTSKVKVLYTLKIALLYLRATMQVA